MYPHIHCLLQVEPTDIAILVISSHFNAACIGEYTRAEFVVGMDELGCDSIAKLKSKLPQLRNECREPRKFKASLPWRARVHIGTSVTRVCLSVDERFDVLACIIAAYQEQLFP